MDSGRIISSASEIDLQRHGVIEAHAGTGKTYTIVNLVLRALERPSDAGGFVHLREILLVTYTEKAAGELKARIQEGIAQRIKELRAATGNETLAAHLEDCLNKMHEALIDTIHSVCLRLLQTWPFETGVHFGTAMTNDSDGIDALLRESMRTDWQDEATLLPQTLKILEQRGASVESKHFALIRKVALKLLDCDTEIDLPYCDGMSLEELLDSAEKPTSPPDLPFKLVYAFIRRAAEALSARYDRHKRENGLVSFDDMLRLMREAVYAKDGVMLKKLRQQLRYGIIDEFQDTSPTQWDIFRKIFIDADTNGPPAAVMYVVGDPKQSIYSFQSADIQSYIAAKNVIAEHGGAAYSLMDNYRSLPETIGGYNAILSPENSPERDNGEDMDNGKCRDWFLFGDNGKISYRPDRFARPPIRPEPKHPLPRKAVQVVPVGKNEDAARKMAEAACSAVRALRGTTVSIPKGPRFEEITLDYKDFAVIVENHKLADPFIEAFSENGIPCVKYKLKGIFESQIARDMIAVLSAVVKRREHQYRAAALLTHFFNRPPETIDPREDLKPCDDPNCAGDALCVAHALDKWGKLADRGLWAQLFESMADRTKIRQRLARLSDGGRKLADLRQITDYCVEYLYRQNPDLEQLTDHLKRLNEESDNNVNDRNYFTLASEKSSVTILTMHASKGLEFPITFVVNRASTKSHRGPDILNWVDGDNKRRFTPYVTIAKESEEHKKLAAPQMKSYLLAQEQERRRLLYVAITRPQAMLFAPKREEENDALSPRLGELLKRGNEYVEIFNAETFGGNAGTSKKTTGDDEPPVRLDDIPALSPRKFIGYETSYTAISKTLSKRGNNALVNNNGDGPNDHDGEDEPSVADPYGGDEAMPFNETHTGDIHIEDPNANRLPGGRLTGIALHEMIEAVLAADDINAVLDNADRLNVISEKLLRRNGIFDHPSIRDPKAVTEIASAMIRDALTTPYPVGDDNVTVSAIPRDDRIAEADFMFSAAPHRVSGSIDLLFRVRNEAHPAHPYRYHFIDWKSDTLKSYDSRSLETHCRDNHYDIQSKIYAAALDKYLRGILGNRYSREENIGSSVYVFLRGGGAGVSTDLKKLDFDDDRFSLASAVSLELFSVIP